MRECEKCHHWYDKGGIVEHQRMCRAMVPDDGQAGQPPERQVVVTDLTSQDKLEWLDGLPWEEVGRCPYSTITCPRGAINSYIQTHRPIEELFDKGEDDRAWKLHFFLIRVLFAPTAQVQAQDDLSALRHEMSATQLVKQRCSSFLRGTKLEWEKLWEGALQAPTAGAHRVNVQGDGEVGEGAVQASQEALQRRREDIRAKKFAREGLLSKAMSIFESSPVLDPREEAVWQQLQNLHAPDTVAIPLPDPPEGLQGAQYEYELEGVPMTTSDGREVTVPTVEYVHNRLKRGIAQSLSGARYEHYKALPVSLVKVMVSKLLNDKVGEGPKAVLTACRGLALDKGEGKARPVAIGEAIRRIAARCVCAQESEAFANELVPLMQFGVGVKGGIEYAYHLVKLHMMTSWDTYERKVTDALDNGGEAPGPDDVPGMLKIDFKNGYNSTQRAKMLAQIQARMPHLLRFARFLYAKPAKFVVMHEGKVVGEIDSVFGTHQGCPLGGHFFALSILDFMREVRDKCPQAAVSWIVDDLTVSGTVGELKEVAKLVDENGPEYGLFKNESKGEFYTPKSHSDDDYRPPRELTRIYRYKSTEGFDKLLGAPLSMNREKVQSDALSVIQKLSRPAKQLHRIQHAQLEFVLLKHCVATIPVHLTRMVEPDLLQEGLRYHENEVRMQLDRIVLTARQKDTLSAKHWKWAKLPVKLGGLGLQDLNLISPAAHADALARVLRRAKEANTPAATLVAAWISDGKGNIEQQRAALASSVNDQAQGDGGDAPNSLCPTLEAYETMPSQHRLSEAMYKGRQKELLERRQDSAESAWCLSRCQFNAGAWLQAIPSLPKFRCGSYIFKIMLQVYLGLILPDTEGIKKCAGCNQESDGTFGTGRHWMNQCNKAWKTLVHNKVRDEIYKMYRSESLRMVADKEVEGLYRRNLKKPADVLVQLPEGQTAFDVTIRDPTAPTYLQLGSDRQPLKAAAKGHEAKLAKHKVEEQSAGLTCQFAFQPLAFETTGAMGRETQKWWKSVLVMEAQLRGEDAPSSRRDIGLEHTWTANSFSSYWRQSIAMTLARAQAEAIVSCIRQSSVAHSESEHRATAEF